MQYNPGDGTGIVDEVLSKLGSGVNLSNYPIAAITRSANGRQHLIWSMAFESYGGWLFMDDNVSDTSTGVPYGDQTITSGTGLYVLPTGSLTVNGAEIKYQNGTIFTPLTLLTQEEFLRGGGDAAYPGTGTPRAAILQGDVIRLLPTPNYTQAASLRVFFDQAMQDFVVGDTTKTPGYASPFHEMLAVGIALDYAESHAGMENKAVMLGRSWDRWEIRLRTFYSNRFKARQPKRIPPSEDLVDEFS